MDVTFATDRGWISQMLSRRLDGLRHVFLRLGLGLEWTQFPQRIGGDDCAAPGAEILGGEVLAGNLAQVIVHVTGFDRAGLSITIDIVEQLLPRQVHAAFDDAGQGAVLHIDLVLFAALTAKMKMYL